MAVGNGTANGAQVKGTSDGAASAENPRVGSDGKTPLLTTGGGHPVSDDNNRCGEWQLAWILRHCMPSLC
jgi:hypothetical protein